MRLHIQNINKIKEADIALNGLTVIVGENDMGKSTIGRAFFSTIKAVSNTRSLSNESSATKLLSTLILCISISMGRRLLMMLSICCLVSNLKWKEYARMSLNEMLSWII